ncbi:MAG: hypothetical protein NT149_00235 [Candidatus Gottesmanbacteria bacterium]|nr:hypothetical protein [Candidatus Gottesmanbacteria bacterium]
MFKQIIARKPTFFLFVSLGYLVVVGLCKWFIHPSLDTVWFFLGVVIGVYLLDAAEVFFAINPSPFRSIVFAGGFVVVSLFIVTSANAMLADGLVLSLYITMLLWQIGEWQITGNLNSWYRMIAGPVSVPLQKWGMIIFAVLFVVETLLFLRWA